MLKNIKLKVHTRYDFFGLIKQLDDFGYERIEKVEMPGQFNVSGGNIIIFATNMLEIIRLEFFGKEIDNISTVNKQGKVVSKKEIIEIAPNILLLPSGLKIKVGDYIVHEDYGIGQFVANAIKKISGEEISYIYIKYYNNEILYLPENLKDKISPYIGVGRRKPKLSKLGSQSWKKSYHKTYENIILLARELLKTYAEREIAKKEPWKINESWKEEIGKTFDYVETADQKSAIKEVYRDMASSQPMDRLVCGDVGFGKTEIAIRTMAQAVINGVQVAFLVPTTILAEQHFVTLKKRFEKLPVNIERLSRFANKAEQSKILEKVNKGEVDILVGTHRIFGEDIKFKRLGLLIIDEEQKFGVKQKEKLKKIKSELSVLSLTATPIPRTLFMALSGIRDISVINNPPHGRKEIETHVSKYDAKTISSAIEKEFKRGGQVYYLHNQVHSIEGAKNKIAKMFPKYLIEVAHGQMSEEKLAKTMSEFADGKINILVCSTIIENGLDLPNVNTLIVEESDRFGLSQLYQIRGRIGRSDRQAYAYFTFKDKKITQNAYKRLKAISENTELGSGYNISLSDLEIRGGGNILGREQHGNMEAVGLVLYTKLLNMAVAKLKKTK